MKTRELKQRIAELEAENAELRRKLEIADRFAVITRGYKPYVPPYPYEPQTTTIVAEPFDWTLVI